MSLRVEGVSMSFGGFKAVDRVSLEIPKGAMVGLIGPNGAGKTTLFANITGFLPDDEGSIHFKGHCLDGLKPEARIRFGIGRTFQIPREFSHLSVRENLSVAVPNQLGEGLIGLFFQPGSVRRQEADVARRVEEIILFLNLRAVADLPAGKLSGGQKKLLEIGRSLLVNPRFLMLDEPFGGVNPVLVKDISEHIRRLHSQGIGFLIVEHNLSALCRLVNSLYVMDRGRIIAQGCPDEVLANPEVREAYMGGKG